MTERYNQLVNYYTENADFHGWGPASASLNGEKCNLLEKYARDKVIDIGTGSGVYANFLSGLGHEVVGVDLQDKFVKQAEKRYKKPKFLKASADKLPFKKDSFETSILFDILEHDDDIAILKEAARVSKRVIITVPRQNQKVLTKWSLAHHHYMDKTHKREYTKGSLRKLMKDSGFKVVHIKGSLPISPEGFIVDLFGENILSRLFLRAVFKLFPRKNIYSTVFAVGDRQT